MLAGVRYTDDSVKLLGIPGQLAQIITNLVTNAVDASPAGSTIVIAIKAHENCTDIVVTDTGRGIPADVLPKIFDFLYTTKVAGKGTGLGLAIVSGIMTDTFAGSIQVETEVGKGTAFTRALSHEGRRPMTRQRKIHCLGTNDPAGRRQSRVRAGNAGTA